MNGMRAKTLPCSETLRTSWDDTVEVMKSVNIAGRELSVILHVLTLESVDWEVLRI